MGCFLIFAMMFTYRGRELVTLPKASGRERLRAFVSAIPGLLMPVIILGGIYGGFFTPTEAAAVASIYGIIVGLATRKLKPADLWPILKDSVSQTPAVVLLIVGTASLFSYALTLTGIASDASAALISICGDSKFLFLLIVNIILLIAGCFIDANSAMYIIVPHPAAGREGARHRPRPPGLRHGLQPGRRPRHPRPSASTCTSAAASRTSSSRRYARASCRSLSRRLSRCCS